MKLTRAHGLGNVYLVLDEGPVLRPQWVQALCDGALGIGADGILEPVETHEADFGVRIWNPDGSIAEKSGNGLRIFARWLADRDGVDQFSVWTGFDRVACEVSGEHVVIHMGRASLEPSHIPMLRETPLVGERLHIAGLDFPAVAVGMGNPHCVLFVDVPEAELDWRRLGAVVERDPRFPNRTNVQFAWVHADRIDIRIWERGAGVTPASGSSACATAVAAVVLGRCEPGAIRVRAPGGDLTVTVTPKLDVTLRGPVEMVGVVSVDPRWIAARIER